MNLFGQREKKTLKYIHNVLGEIKSDLDLMPVEIMGKKYGKESLSYHYGELEGLRVAIRAVLKGNRIPIYDTDTDEKL